MAATGVEDAFTTNLYLAGSPLQLLSALEARERFPAERHVLALHAPTGTRNYEQIERVLALAAPWDEIVTVPFLHRNASLPLQALRLAAFRRKMGARRYARVFLSDYNSITRRFLAAGMSYDELILLDDGMASVNIHRHPLFLRPEPPVGANPAVMAAYLRTSLARRLGFFADPVPTLFTCFSLTPHPGQRVVPNDFTFTRALLRESGRRADESVYFVGQPYLDRGFTTPQALFDALRFAQAYYQGKRFIYLAHRAETPEALDRLSYATGMETLVLENAIEIEFLLRRETPAAIAGFCSTALVTLPRIFPGIGVTAFEIPPGLLSDIDRERITLAYRYLEENGVPVVPVAPVESGAPT